MDRRDKQDTGIDKLLNKTGSAYKLVVLASTRAIELGEGAAKLVDTNPDSKVMDIALKEIIEGKITYKRRAKNED
ncbi:MAG: DNA-directed RNA polymerase subunit omega [Candidatus Omnitrophota bacterium]|nr:DNA-directed RNA polymerase subunit omega [Candidatus Omnitrophota bacterium]